MVQEPVLNEYAASIALSRSSSPIGMGTVLAHYYRFEELAKGMKIVQDTSSPVGFTFDPKQPISIDDSVDVIQMVDDPQLVQFDAADAKAAQLADPSDVAYSDLLRILQDIFSGQPEKIIDALIK